MTYMPEKIYVFNDPKSIGDLGFTRTDKQEDHEEYTLSSLCVPRSEYDKLKQHADRLALGLEKSLRLCKKYIEENYPKEHHSGHETAMGYLTPMQQALAEYRKETE